MSALLVIFLHNMLSCAAKLTRYNDGLVPQGWLFSNSADRVSLFVGWGCRQPKTLKNAPENCPNFTRTSLKTAEIRPKTIQNHPILPGNSRASKSCQPQFFKKSSQPTHSTRDKDRSPLRVCPLQFAILEPEASNRIRAYGRPTLGPSFGGGWGF